MRMLPGLVVYEDSDSEAADDDNAANYKKQTGLSLPLPPAADKTVDAVTHEQCLTVLSTAESRDLFKPPSLSTASGSSLKTSLRVLPPTKPVPASYRAPGKRILIAAPDYPPNEYEYDEDVEWMERKKHLSLQAAFLFSEAKTVRKRGLLAVLPKPSAKFVVPNRVRMVTGSTTDVVADYDAEKDVTKVRKLCTSSSINRSHPAHRDDKIDGFNGMRASGERSTKAADIIRNAEQETHAYLQQIMTRASTENAYNETDPAISFYTSNVESSSTSFSPGIHEENSADVLDEQLPLEPHTVPGTRNGRPQSVMLHGKCVEIVDVNADDHLIGTERAVLMSLSGGMPPMQSSSKWLKSVAPEARRKHQITYLAAQAKAREEELQNHWATGRANRKSSSMKYGF